jgi:hypothetical protein
MLLDSPSVGFAQRQNPDGSVDVICLRCFDTVASITDQRATEDFKTEHACQPFRSLQYSAA